jgi:polyphenol oxidase
MISKALTVPHAFLGIAEGLDSDAIPGRRLVRVKQIHSAVCVEAGDWREEDRPEADALVTDKPGIALGIVTADCAPVLFADAEAGVIGAAHAGWKGAFGGVLEATVEAMRTLGARKISAAIGPCIAQKNYEVSEGFTDPKMEAVNPGYFERRYLWKPRRTRQFFFDLEAYVFDRLCDLELGGEIDLLGEDTYSQPLRFHSFRRATHEGAPDYGRQISLIALP